MAPLCGRAAVAAAPAAGFAASSVIGCIGGNSPGCTTDGAADAAGSATGAGGKSGTRRGRAAGGACIATSGFAACAGGGTTSALGAGMGEAGGRSLATAARASASSGGVVCFKRSASVLTPITNEIMATSAKRLKRSAEGILPLPPALLPRHDSLHGQPVTTTPSGRGINGAGPRLCSGDPLTEPGRGIVSARENGVAPDSCR